MTGSHLPHQGRPINAFIVSTVNPSKHASLSSPEAAKQVEERSGSKLPVLQSESKWLFELHSVSSQPIVDLERTLLSACGFPKQVHGAVALQAYAKHRNLYALVRLALLAFTPLVFVHACSTTSTLVVWVVVVASLAFGAAPLLVLVALSALDVAKLLLCTYECWFVSILNAMHWICVASIVGLPRAFMCVVAWLSIQSVIMLDANFRTFPAASKAAIACIPLLLAIGVACAFGFVADARLTLLSTRGGFLIDTGSVVAFSSSTLVLFMSKKVYATCHQLQERELEMTRFRVVPCVVLKARLELRPLCSGRRAAIVGSARLRDHANMRQLLSATKQSMRVTNHWSTTFVLDARRILVPWLHRVWVRSPESRASKALSLFVAVAGAVGFAASVAAWLLLFLTCPLELVYAKSVVGVVAVSGSHIYALATYLLCQRDLFLALLTNFDLMFSAFQCQALGLAMMDMLQWRPHSCLAVVAWWFWFNWLFMHDALTAPTRRLLHFRRRFALCVIAWVLGVSVAVLALIFVDDEADSAHKLLVDRRVWVLEWGGARPFELHTKDFAVQRIVTIVGWSTRLVLELARSDRHEELLFIRQPVEYSCPAVFRRRSASGRAASRRRTRGASVSRVIDTPPPTRQVSAPLGAAKVVPLGSWLAGGGVKARRSFVSGMKGRPQ